MKQDFASRLTGARVRAHAATLATVLALGALGSCVSQRQYDEKFAGVQTGVFQHRHNFAILKDNAGRTGVGMGRLAAHLGGERAQRPVQYDADDGCARAHA